MKKPLLLLSLMLFAVIFAQAKQWEVDMTPADQFSVLNLIINKGDTVVWKNTDTDNHTSTSGPSTCTPDGLWNSGDVTPGSTFKRKFDVAGTFPYYCIHHCASDNMFATITVNNVGVSAITSASFSNLNLSTFPNPFVQNVKVGFTLEKESAVKIEFTDLQGRLLYVKPETVLAPGDQKLEFEGSSFGEGMIIFKMTIDGIPAASETLIKGSSK